MGSGDEHDGAVGSPPAAGALAGVTAEPAVAALDVAPVTSAQHGEALAAAIGAGDLDLRAAQLQLIAEVVRGPLTSSFGEQSLTAEASARLELQLVELLEDDPTLADLLRA